MEKRKNSIKILHIISGLGIGGAENMLLNLILMTNKQKFYHQVICLTEQGEIGKKIQSTGTYVISLKMPRGCLTVYGINKLLKIANDFNPDIVTSWMYHSNIVALLLNWIKKVPVCWKIHHSLDGFKLEKKLTKIVIYLNMLLSSKPNSIIFDSLKAVEQHKQLGFNIKKSIVLPIGFDCSQYRPNDALKYTYRESIGLGQNDLVIGIVGRYHPLKDHKNFLKAASFVIEKLPEAKFILVGYNMDNNNIELIDYAKALNIFKNTKFLGIQENLQAVYVSLDIFCLASLSEGFPTVVGEAMSCGVPCVVTDVGDAAYIVGETGRCVAPHDPAALAHALCSVIELQEVQRKKLGDAARQRIQNQFSLENIIKKYEDHYTTLLNSN